MVSVLIILPFQLVFSDFTALVVVDTDTDTAVTESVYAAVFAALTFDIFDLFRAVRTVSHDV